MAILSGITVLEHGTTLMLLLNLRQWLQTQFETNELTTRIRKWQNSLATYFMMRD